MEAIRGRKSLASYVCTQQPRPKVSSIFLYISPWFMAPLKSLTHIIIDRDHYYIYRSAGRPPMCVCCVPYINIVIAPLCLSRIKSSSRPSCYSQLFCVERMRLMIEYVNFKVGKTRPRAIEEQLLAYWTLADGWGWRHKILHASSAKCCILFLFYFFCPAPEREREKKGLTMAF